MLDSFNQRYDRIRHDRKQIIDAPAPVRPGLAVLTSLGSRGLSAAPLAAELLVDQLLGTLAPRTALFAACYRTGTICRASA